MKNDTVMINGKLVQVLQRPVRIGVKKCYYALKSGHLYVRCDTPPACKYTNKCLFKKNGTARKRTELRY